ncbi:MAG: DNA polymerase IV [Clostridiales bacterium]
MAKRVIFHIDVNSAFLSWSAAEHLYLGGSVDYRTINSAVAKEGAGKGIILAKSDGAKACGVKTAEPIWQAKEKCPDLYIVPPNYGLYLRASAAMKKLFFDYTPLVEPFSIDECFLDMTGQEKFFGEPLASAYIIKERIKNELGFTVNIGIGNNKPLAKMASELKKPDMVNTLWQEEIPEKLWTKPIDFLFMAGRQSVKKLRRIGIDTVGKLAELDEGLTHSLLGKSGDMLRRYANGIDDEPVLPGELPPPKSLSQSITLPLVLADESEAEPIFVYIAENLSAKLRKQKMTASVISVAVKDGDRNYKSKQRHINEPLLHRRIILKYALPLLAELWPKHGARYVGLSLGGLSTNRTLEGSLFSSDILKEERLDDAVYAIKNRYGDESIHAAILLDSGVKSLFRDIDEDEDDGEDPPRFF